MTVKQRNSAVAAVEGVALAYLRSEDGNLFDPRSDCAATIDQLSSDRMLNELATGGVPREYFERHLAELVQEISRDRRAVIESTRMCESSAAIGSPASFGVQPFGVQHCASRIIVQGDLDPHSGFVTSVQAKPWEDGARVYMRAAELVPSARWKAGSLTPFSDRLRAKLHRVDPYRWQYNACLECRGTVDWAGAASANDFPPHRSVEVDA